MFGVNLSGIPSGETTKDKQRTTLETDAAGSGQYADSILTRLTRIVCKGSA